MSGQFLTFRLLLPQRCFGVTPFSVSLSQALRLMRRSSIAAVAETGSADEIEGVTSTQIAALEDHFSEAGDLEGLEIGVAGLAYALAAAGMYPAASCRGHVGPNAWSSSPVVFFVADRPHAEVLQPLVKESGCGFEVDPARSQLLVILSVSIAEMLALGRRILDNNLLYSTCNLPRD
jgi:hypothetical protein